MRTMWSRLFVGVITAVIPLLFLAMSAGTAEAGKGGIPLAVTLDNTVAGFRGDGTGSSAEYVDGDASSCATTCLRVQLISNAKTLTFDTRGTTRVVNVESTTPPFSKIQGLFEVLSSVPLTSMGLGEPNSQHVPARLWFEDDGVNWRVDWARVRVVKHSATLWHVIAESGDKSDEAGLSRLDNSKRAKPRTVLTGMFKVPFFITADSDLND